MNPEPSSSVEYGLVHFTRKAAGVIRYYRELHGLSAKNGGDAYRLTASGMWAASRPAHLYYFFRKINLASFKLFLDLGSGDGIVSCLAGIFTRSVGIEVDPELASRAEQAAWDLGLERRVGFICGDFFTQRIQNADCLFIYPDKPLYVLEELLRGWRGTLLVYGPHFPPERFLLKEKLRCRRETLSVYRQ
jgi:hypothetical protein